MTKKKKILHAIRQGEIGGGETHVLDLVNELDTNKFESVILSFTEGPMIEKLKSQGFKTYVINTKKPFNFLIWGEVKKLILQERIDIIHAHGTRANSNTFYSSKSIGIPLIYTVHGWSFHPNQNILIKKIRTLSEMFLVGMADKTICVSESNLKEGMRKFSMKRASVVLNGINHDKFNPDNIYPNIRTEFGINENDVLVGYIARITHQKSPLLFLRAISKLNLTDKVRFLIVGDGDLKNKMLNLATELGLNKSITFVNFRNDIPAILNAVDIFCLPSLWEGLPIALLEAMAMRKAIIASNIDGITDLISSGTNGILVEPNDVDGLSSALKLLIEDGVLRKELGENAEKTTKESFNVGKMTLEIERIYNTLNQTE